MRRQAAQTADPLDFRGIVSFQQLRTLLAVAGSVLVLFLASTAFAGHYYAILLGRLLNPFSSLTYPTRTTIDEISAPVAVKLGDDVTIEAVAGGEVPDDGRLFIQVGDAPWDELLLPRGSAGDRPVFRHRLTKAERSLAFYFRIGDARSQPQQVKVVPPPRILEAKVHLDYPEYTGRKAETVTGFQLPRALEGTAVSWDLHCDQELRAGQLLFLGKTQRSLDLAIDPHDRRRARLALADVADLLAAEQATHDPVTLAYYFEWTENEHGFTFIDPTRHALEVVPDKPPVVTLLKPRAGASENDRILATTRKDLHLIFEATDDYGLGKAWITYRINKQPDTRRLAIGAFPAGSRAGSFQNQHWIIKESLPDIKEGDILTCAVEVSDNRAGKAGPNRSRSSSFQMQVVSDAEYQQYIERQVAQGLERTTAAAREELISSKKVKSLIPER
jgi:hypothetical protein